MNNGFTTKAQKNALSNVAKKMASVTFYLATKSANVTRSAIICFARFIVAYDHELIPGQDMPDVMLCEFIVWMALSGKHKSIRTYISMGPRLINF